MSKYKYDLMSIGDWVSKHNDSAWWVYDDLIHGLRRFGMDRQRVINYMCLFNENDMLMFELLWSMLLQVNPRIISKAYPTVRYNSIFN